MNVQRHPFGQWMPSPAFRDLLTLAGLSQLRFNTAVCVFRRSRCPLRKLTMQFGELFAWCSAAKPTEWSTGALILSSTHVDVCTCVCVRKLVKVQR